MVRTVRRPDGRSLAAAAIAAAAVPLLWATAAAAADHDVTFRGGGLGVLSCESRPDVGELRVTPEATIGFTNNLGQPATLRIDGADSGRVARGATIEVRFHRGPVSVQLVPDCVLNLSESFGSVTVQVARPSAEPAALPPPPPPAPAASGGTDAPAQRAGSGTTDRAPAGAAAPPGWPSATAPVDAADPAAPEDPAGAEDPDAAALDDWRATVGSDGVGPGDLPTGPATVLDDSRSQPVAYSAQRSHGGAFGLLALLATVCVAGVTVGAIRAIAAQRATRTSWA